MKPSKPVIIHILLALLLTAGYVQLLAAESTLITGSVYCDHNQNGSFDNDEKGLENIHIQIFAGQCGGNALQMIHTDEEGNFTFQGFDAGTYFIRADVACVCGGRMPTTTSCQKLELSAGQTISLPPFGYSEYGQ
jgi:hypothetical protein